MRIVLPASEFKTTPGGASVEITVAALVDAVGRLAAVAYPGEFTEEQVQKLAKASDKLQWKLDVVQKVNEEKQNEAQIQTYSSGSVHDPQTDEPVGQGSEGHSQLASTAGTAD